MKTMRQQQFLNMRWISSFSIIKLILRLYRPYQQFCAYLVQFENTKAHASLNLITAIIRGNPSDGVPSLLFATEDRKEGVVDVLTRLVCESDESVQVRTKAAFLLNCLVADHDVREYLFKNKERQFQDLKEKNENIR